MNGELKFRQSAIEINDLNLGPHFYDMLMYLWWLLMMLVIRIKANFRFEMKRAS